MEFVVKIALEVELRDGDGILIGGVIRLVGIGMGAEEAHEPGLNGKSDVGGDEDHGNDGVPGGLEAHRGADIAAHAAEAEGGGLNAVFVCHRGVGEVKVHAERKVKAPLGCAELRHIPGAVLAEVLADVLKGLVPACLQALAPGCEGMRDGKQL